MEARRSRNLAVLDRFAGRDDGAHVAAEAATESLDQARVERDSTLMSPPEPSAGAM